MKRRSFLKNSGSLTFALSTIGWINTNLKGVLHSQMAGPDLFFRISLAQWSLNRSLFKKKLDNLDFAAKAKKDFGIEGIEYVNVFFKDKAKDKKYLDEMNKRAQDHGVTQLLIMVDMEGNLGELNEVKRQTAVENHYKWVEAAKYLDCHSIRVNAYGKGEKEDIQKAAIESLGSLATFAKDYDINVVVENHGGYSSDGKWLSTVMEKVNMSNCGTLPDFGNFCVKNAPGGGGKCAEEYDRYLGVKELMPYAKSVSAKSYHFDGEGNETQIDFFRMLKIVKKAGFSGWIGIEYEGSKHSEDEGILATKNLLEKAGAMV